MAQSMAIKLEVREWSPRSTRFPAPRPTNSMSRKSQQKSSKKSPSFSRRDVIAVWIAENNGPPHFVLKGAFGFTAHNVEQLEATEWSFPMFEQTHQDLHQLVLNNPAQMWSRSLVGVCERERIVCAALNPVVRRHDLVGLIGIFSATRATFRRPSPRRC